MNRYESSTPHAALGLTAVAMAAITFGVLVVLPAEFDSVSAAPNAIAVAKTATGGGSTATPGSSARGDPPELVIHDEHAQADCTTLGAQALRGNSARKHCAENITD